MKIYLTNIKYLILVVAFIITNIGINYSNVNAAPLRNGDPIAVMDFGTRPGATSSEINIQNAEYTNSEYIILQLIKNGNLDVIDKDTAMSTIRAENLNTTGLIDPDTAKRIGKLLGVKHIIYGNVSNVSTSNNGVGVDVSAFSLGVDVCTVKAHLIARVMDVETGAIIMMLKGDGESKSSYTKAGVSNVVLSIGTSKVTMDSVHNAIQKAGVQIADKLSAKLAK